MDIADFVCNAAEENTEIQSFLAAELLSNTTDIAFLETVTESMPTKYNDAVEEESYAMTAKQGVDAVQGVVLMLTDHPDIEKKLGRDLRLLQSRAREKLRLEAEEH
ncbi:hypothetical protein GN244_ATG05162 [Phytophthora infestans]|uniref:Uncharacterized protein n=1 Tax=Phytophthora infestans TaxID=4787 RepID=A0A833WMR0_PHYIN|nr:hypothetical protein GN244_ATG05162 [Phytophthora infestans]